MIGCNHGKLGRFTVHSPPPSFAEPSDEMVWDEISKHERSLMRARVKSRYVETTLHQLARLIRMYRITAARGTEIHCNGPVTVTQLEQQQGRK